MFPQVSIKVLTKQVALNDKIKRARGVESQQMIDNLGKTVPGKGRGNGLQWEGRAMNGEAESVEPQATLI